ncbi:MAG TPA: hypothetical protein ENG87_00470, partial [Candidatus Pacearchaeota archaeon]|nr:hypothetical protein [Candidatus Pacearchaeota archaeon]
MKRNTRKNKMKENKKYPYKKGGRNRTSKLVLTILFSFIFMFSIANVSAFLSVGHYKQLTNQTNYSGTIVIGKHLFFFFGKSSTEVDYTLTSNTVSVINGEATGTATLYTDGVLFSGKKFKGGEVKNSKIYIWVNQTKQVEVPDYKQECEIDYSNSTNGTQICKQIKIGSHNKTVDNFHWQVYNKEKLPAGNYTWKLTGQRKPNQAIDWILTSGIGNKNLNEWAWWNNSWNYRQLITINYSDSVNLSSYWVNFTYSPPTGHFANDFSDLRLVNYDATDEFVWKYSAKNSTSIDVWVFTDSSTQNITNGQIKFYAYYNTSTPVSHGWTTGFYYGDTFTNVTSTDWTTGLTTAGTYTLDATTSSLKYTGNGAGTGSSMYHNLPSEVSGWEDITINFNATWGGSINNDGSYYFAGITATGADPSDTWIGYFLNGKTSNYGTSDLSNVWAANINGAYQDVGATISNTWIDGKVIQTGNSNSSSVARTQRLIWGGDMTTGDITETTSSYQFTTSPACHISSDDRYSGQTTMTSWLLISHGNGTQTGYSVGAEISKVMQFSITYPQNITYSENVSTISYTSSGVLPDYCWYSRDGGTTNSSLFVGGNNLTNIYSVSGSNTWWLYCNDSSNNNASDSITFTENKLWNNSGYPTLDKEFRVNEFINVSGNNFTLGGNPYTLQGVNSYYLVDYATNHTYDDDGNEINNSRDAVNEILGEAHDLGINVIRTWANMQGGNDTYWIINNSGGHYNLFEVGVPGNYSNQTLEALDWLISEAGKKDIRLQLVLINNWDDYGGMRWYAQESPTTDKTYQWINDTSDPNYWLFHDQFYNDTNTMTYYKNYVNMLLNRNNTVTGRLYKDDPTIFAWLLANEPRAKSDGDGSQELIKTWTTNMTAYIKSIDSNHLVGLGIEGWGDPFDGTSFVDDQNGTGVDFATFELHPDQWDWFAQRSENITDLGWQTGGVNSTSTVDWWTNGTQESYNNRYEGSYIPNYNPSLARHAYDNWVKQNVLWANDLGLPVLMQEVAMPTSSNDSIKDRFFQQAIHTFFSNGGDGFIYWNLNHDNYYYSTTPDGVMDDGYSFYVSDDPTLKAKSQSVIDAFNFTKYDNNGGSWVVSLNNYAYDFITNVGWANDINIINSTLFLNISDGTTWRQEQKSNNSVIVVNTN